jgi:hypothetical protein
MAIETQVQVFDSFMGLSEGVHDVILPDIFSSGGSKNVWMDKFARVKKILGYDNQNTSALTTDTGGSAAKVVGLFGYRSTSGGSTTRELIVVIDDEANEWEIHKSTNDGQTFALLKDMGASNGAIPDFAQFGDELYITDGGNTVPQVYDGSTISNAGGTQSPTPSGADGGAGLLVGAYEWKLVSVESDGSRHPGSAASSTLQIVDKAADITWTADTDMDVTGYELYRTTGTGGVFYFVDYIDGRLTASYTDNSDDKTILSNRNLSEHGEAPPAAYFVESHKLRMWYARTDALPRTAYWSDPGDADSLHLANNFMNFTDTESEGDVITAMLGNYEGTLVVFLERSIWRVSGTGQVIGNIVDWNRFRTNADTGCVSHNAIVRVPAGSRFIDQTGEVQQTEDVTLAYMTPLADVRIWDGDNDTIVSHPVRETLSGLNYAQRNKVVSVHDSVRSHITWFFPDGTATENDTAITWNYRWGTWAVWNPMPFASVLAQDSSTEAQMILAGESSTATGAFVYKLWEGNSFNGSDIEAIWMTKALFGIAPSGAPAISFTKRWRTKRWRWWDIVMESVADVTLEAEWLSGFAADTAAPTGSKTLTPQVGEIVTADGDTITSTGGDTLVASDDSLHARVLTRDGEGNAMNDEAVRFRLRDTSQSNAWGVEGMALAYQVKPGIRERSAGVS